MRRGDHHEPLKRESEREMRKSPHRFLDTKEPKEPKEKPEKSERGFDPGDQSFPCTAEERWQREVDGRPSLENEDALLERLKQVHPEMWEKLCRENLGLTT